MTDTSSTDDGRASRGVERRVSRRKLLATATVVGTGSLAGCGGLFGGGDGGDGSGQDVSLSAFRGSGPLVSARGDPGGTSIEEMPDLEGKLNFYLGGGEGGLYLDLIELVADIYPDFSFNRTLDSSRSLANRILQESEAGTSPADLFLSVDAGSLAQVANEGATTALSGDVVDAVPESLRTEQWVGIAGRARAIPYNTNQISESDIPDTVQEFPQTPALADSMGWAPTYSAFQSFITAMRLLHDDDATRQWLNRMLDHGVESFDNEFVISNEVANGALTAGFANHYYALRVQNARQNAPIDLAFTSGEAGALINVSGAEIIQGTDNEELAQNFIRHLLSSEAQEFFATRTFAYPTVAGIQPVGGLPTVDELNPPDIELSELADTGPTLDLLNEVGLL